MSDPKVQAAINRLQQLADSAIGTATPAELARMAYLQAVMCNAALQAFVRLVKQKNLVSDRELDEALRIAYTDAAEQFIAPQIVMPVRRQ